MCDVESYCYLPLLEELNYIPKHKYSFAPEILEYSKSIASHYGLYDNALLQTSVTSMTWDEKDEMWIIQTDRGDRMRLEGSPTLRMPVKSSEEAMALIQLYGR